MKEIKRIISVNVNGKKVDIRFFTDSEIIEKLDKGGKLLCHFCKFFDFCNNNKLKNPHLLDDNSSSFNDFCISVGVIGKNNYNYNSRLSLDTVRKEFPELYEGAAAHCKEVGDNDISIYDLVIPGGGNDKFLNLMPTYEDVEPILENLKK